MMLDVASHPMARPVFVLQSVADNYCQNAKNLRPCGNAICHVLDRFSSLRQHEHHSIVGDSPSNTLNVSIDFRISGSF